MSDELNLNADLNLAADSAAEEEYEEISSEEVDRVIEALESLMESVESENIQALLEEATTSIMALVYDEDDFEDVQDEAA